jgi:hypothetical protein
MIKLMNIANYLQIQNSSSNWVNFHLNLTVSLSLYNGWSRVNVCVYFFSIASLPGGLLCWYWFSVYIELNRPINSIVIGWMSLTRIASLDTSLPFNLLQSTAEMELCLLLNCNNRFCYSLWLCRNLFDSNSTDTSIDKQALSSLDRI